jgi:hypothetical protein
MGGVLLRDPGRQSSVASPLRLRRHCRPDSPQPDSRTEDKLGTIRTSEKIAPTVTEITGFALQTSSVVLQVIAPP